MSGTTNFRGFPMLFTLILCNFLLYASSLQRLNVVFKFNVAIKIKPEKLTHRRCLESMIRLQSVLIIRIDNLFIRKSTN